MPQAPISRRIFLGGALATLAGCATRPKQVRRRSPNDRLNIAGIGVGGKGKSDVWACRDHNVIALCDVDERRGAASFRNFPKARRYEDFRRMLDQETDLDAVTISTADHTHAVAAMAAMERGLHVFVQKPLTWSVQEARRLQEAANYYGVATQMGNQGHAFEDVRKLSEAVWTGAIGSVREVHCWTNRPVWPQGVAEPLPREDIPDYMAWDLWLGPAPKRPFNRGYAPFNWRGWYDFGCGALGDMACHIMDPAYYALQLGAPTRVECVAIEGRNSETFPERSITRFDFPERTALGMDFPEVTLYWYDGGYMPERPADVPENETLGDGDNGSFFVGDKGVMTCGTYSSNPRFVSANRNEEFEWPEPVVARVPENDIHLDWLRACMGGPPACSNFNYAAPFTETVLLGVVASKVEGPLEWDAGQMRFTNAPEANALLYREYRKGWELG